MPRVLIFAYGNPLRGDDGVGWIVGAELQRTLTSNEIEILQLQQLLPELAEKFVGADAIIFVDAICDGVPGAIQQKPLTATPGEVRFSHHLSPPDLLALGRQLYGATPKAFAVTLTGENFEHREELSELAAARIPQLASAVERLTIEILESTPPAG